MNIPQFIKMAKCVLNEDAGSEGMQYIVEAKSGLKAIETETFKIVEVSSENGIQSAKVEFTYPQDYGLALNTIKEALNDIDITSLKLVF